MFSALFIPLLTGHRILRSLSRVRPIEQVLHVSRAERDGTRGWEAGSTHPATRVGTEAR